MRNHPSFGFQIFVYCSVNAFFSVKLDMKPFLYELAKTLYEKHSKLDDLTVVFPNRRAILYFRKHLSTLLNKPAFSPRLVAIEDFMAQFANTKIPDKLELVHELYQSYHEIIRRSTPDQTEPFDKFYFWGDMLLRDFDEVDKYMLPAEQLFKDLSRQKELDSSFDYLTDEQREFLISFWSSFEEGLTENKRKFLTVWNRLHELYRTFRDRLAEKGLAYEGMMHRIVAERIHETAGTIHGKLPICFAGFNALTRAEEKIVSYFVEQGIAEVYWDLDAYYVNDNTQEAGRFFREYQQHPVLAGTFADQIPSHFLSGISVDQPKQNSGYDDGKRIRLFGAAEPIGQAKLLAQILRDELEKGIDPEDTLIVLPDEKLLLPVLHGISGYIEKLNITMGFPFTSTPLFNLVELLIEMQIACKDDHFSHRQVLTLLGHPYVVAADAAVANNKRKEILNNNWVHIPSAYLGSGTLLHRILFKTAQHILPYLRDVLTCIGSLEPLSDFDKEYTFHFLRLLNRMEEVIGEATLSTSHSNDSSESSENNRPSLRERQASLRSFLRLFRQLIQAYKIPFTGEPLRGLQVMGVLETRGLDYKNVFVLSMNEGAFPAAGNQSSYIPFNIRRAYGLPTSDHQDAMYAYLFYRMLQRSRNVFLFYNSETDVLGQGEMSRYLQQLVFESGIPLERNVMHNPIQPAPIKPIVVTKDEGIMEKINKLSEGNILFRGISPSALNTYLECRLRFYFRHIARIKEPNEVEEDLDARVLGNFVHLVMEKFYKRLLEQKNDKRIEKRDLEDVGPLINDLIDEVFVDAYRLERGKKVHYEGQRLVVREIVDRFAHRIVEADRDYAPFTIESLEQEGLLFAVKLSEHADPVILGGKIDRVDRKENVVRVIDYKTGKDQLDFESVASLFSREPKRNKAAFQTVLYALLYRSNTRSKELKIVPGLINRMNLFDKDFHFGLKIGKKYVSDVEPLLPEFEVHLKILLSELYNPEVPFDQTDVVEACRFCPYQGICYR
jgi:hypothetical protein